MSLPMNSTPVYTLTIPSTKKQFKYRPFLVRDQKALLIAQQSEDINTMLDTVKDVIKSCAKTPVDVDRLASFDIEYIFLQLRASSVGEYVELVFQCDDDHGDQNEQARATVQLDLRKASVIIPPDHTDKIELFNDVGVVMKYPTLDTLKKLEQLDESNIDQVFGVVVDCIDYIYSSEEVFASKDQSMDEMLEFLNNLTPDQFEKLQGFFRSMPSLRIDVEYTCPVCGKAHKKYMEGLQSFF